MARIKIYADENINYKIVKGLRRRGVEIVTVQELHKWAVDDEEQLEYAKSMGTCLFTHDDDLLKVAKKWRNQGKIHNGIIYVHQQKLRVSETIRKLKLLVETVSLEEMKNHIEFL